MMKQRANINILCEIGQNVHRNISNVTGGLWEQSHLRNARAQCGKI